MRAMIVATTTLVAGVQLTLTAFMASLLDIPLLERRQQDVTTTPRRRSTDA
jgi:hypothetical protein